MPTYLACWEGKSETEEFSSQQKPLFRSYNYIQIGGGGNIFLSNAEYNSVLCGGFNWQRIFYSASLKIQSYLNWFYASFKWATLYIPNELFPVKNCVDVNRRWQERHQSQLGVTGVFQPILDRVLKSASQATRANAQKHAHVFTGSDVLISKATALSEHKTHTSSISWSKASQSITTRAT